MCVGWEDVNNGDGLEMWMLCYRAGVMVMGGWMKAFAKSGQLDYYFGGAINRPVTRIYYITKGADSCGGANFAE